MHREKVKILVEAGADLIAFETIPNKLEAQVFTNKQIPLLCYLLFMSAPVRICNRNAQNAVSIIIY